MSHHPEPTPPRRSLLDSLAYALCAVAVAVIAVLTAVGCRTSSF